MSHAGQAIELDEFADYRPSAPDEKIRLRRGVLHEREVIRAEVLVPAGMALLLQGFNATRLAHATLKSSMLRHHSLSRKFLDMLLA